MTEDQNRELYKQLRERICEIMNDEIQHFQELEEAIRLINPNRLVPEEIEV